MKTLRQNDLIARVRRESDLDDSTFVTDAEIVSYLNEANTYLYNVVIEANEDFFTRSKRVEAIDAHSFLPQDFYKLRAIDRESGGRFYTLRQANFLEREGYQNTQYRPYVISGFEDYYRYTLSGKSLMLHSQGLLGEFILWYIPAPRDVGSGAEYPEGWENYLVYSACETCRIKEETAYNSFTNKKNEALKGVKSFCQERDFSKSQTITDVYADNYLDLGGYGISFIEQNFGNSEILLPYLMSCDYFDFVGEYDVKKANYIKIDDTHFFVGFEMPQSVAGLYGQWVAAYVTAGSGILYATHNKNKTYSSINDLVAALKLGDVDLIIDSVVYHQNFDAITNRCLFYTNDFIYRYSLTNPVLPPLGERKQLFETPDTDDKEPLTPIVPETDVDVTYNVGWSVPKIVAADLAALDVTGYSSITTKVQPVQIVLPVTDSNAHLVIVTNQNKALASVSISNFEQVAAFTLVGKVDDKTYYVSNNLLLASLSGTTIDLRVS